MTAFQRLVEMPLSGRRESDAPWSAQDWIVDVVDKLVLAEATALAYDRLTPVAGSPGATGIEGLAA